MVNGYEMNQSFDKLGKGQSESTGVFFHNHYKNLRLAVSVTQTLVEDNQQTEND